MSAEPGFPTSIESALELAMSTTARRRSPTIYSRRSGMSFTAISVGAATANTSLAAQNTAAKQKMNRLFRIVISTFEIQ